MADTVGTAEFLVKIKDMVTGPMKSIGANITGTLKNIGVIAAGNLLAAGVLRAVDAAKGFVAQGLAANAEFDKLNNTFTAMLGGEQRAAALMKELNKFAAATPFDLQGLAQASAALLATKQIGQREVIPMLQKLGDAAAGSTEGFAAMPRVVRAITQMLSKGKLQAEEMMQLAEAGIPAWSALADKMGLSTAEVQALAQKGKLGIKEIMLLVEGLGDKYKGLAEKQSKTFEGLQSTIADNFSMALAKITRPIYDRLTKLMAGVVKVMDSPAFQVAIDKITAGISYIIQLFDRVVDSAVAFAGSLRTAFSGPDGEKFRGKLAEIWALVVEIGLNLRDTFMAALQGVSALLGNIFGQTAQLQQGFMGLIDASLDWLKSLLDTISILTTNWAKTWEFMKASAYAAIVWIGDQLVYTLNERIPFAAAALFEGMMAGAREFTNHWQTLFNALVLFIDDLFRVWFDAQKARIMALVEAAKAIAAGRPGDAAAALAGGMAKADADQAKGMADAATNFAKNIAPAAKSIGDKIAEAMAGVMKAMPAFKPSKEGERANKAAADIWESMRKERSAKRAERAIGALDSLGGPMDANGNPLPDFFDPKRGAADQKKKKDKPVEFVAYEEMNKRIQTMLGKKDKEDAALEAAKKGAAAAQRGAVAGEQMVAVAKDINKGVQKFKFGFGQ